MKAVPIQQATKLTDIPGVGKSIAVDLASLGYSQPSDLKGQNPEAMYERLMAQAGDHVDRCILYVFRSAVYYASTVKPDPDKLLWWSHKDN
ncbi:MAG: helix-hairpin-helix domain-containing protein [Candidatus Saccharimonadales bacterium]